MTEYDDNREGFRRLKEVSYANMLSQQENKPHRRSPSQRKKLAEQVSSDVEAFLANGGEIKQIPDGVSGYEHNSREAINRQ